MEMTPRSLRRACAPAFALLLLSLLPIGCGGGDRGEGTEGALAAPVKDPENEGGSGHLRLAGSQNAEADVAVGCDITSDKGLQFTFAQPTDPRLPQVQVQIDDYQKEGSYDGVLVVRSGAAGQEPVVSRGSARIEVHTRQVTGVRGRTELSGRFEGSYAGPAGQGTAAGQIARCVILKELVQ